MLDPTRHDKAKTFTSDGLADSSFKPLIARTFPLDQIVEAHRNLETNQQVGKVIVSAYRKRTLFQSLAEIVLPALGEE